MKQNPLEVNGTDVIVEMKMRDEPNVVLQRGEAIIDKNGELKVSGRALKRETGTERNYGLNKIMYKHNVPKEEIMQIPRILRKLKPVEVSQSGKQAYKYTKDNGEIFKFSTSPFNNYRTISSMYKL